MWESSGSRPSPGAAPTPNAPNAPKVMGRFRCEAKLSAEPPFETYRARVGGLGGFDQVFALTALAPGALGRRPHAAEGLLRAARAATTVKDARLAGIVESGLAPGSAFVVAEFVHGITLRELIAHVEAGGAGGIGPGAWTHICATVGADVAGALAAAHGATPAVVHGALSLTNIMITPQGTAKLLDLGLYAGVHAPAEVAQAPSRRGLVAPELGRTGYAPAADVFALGAALSKLSDAPGAAQGAPSGATLTALLRTLKAGEPAQRPAARAAESALREIATDTRASTAGGAGGALATIVRAIMRQRPAVTDVAEPAPAAPAPAEDVASQFSDEPTAVVDVSAGAKSASLAAILRELRGQERSDEANEFVDEANARAAAQGLIDHPEMMPDSGATRLAPMPLLPPPAAARPRHETPMGGFASEPPPSPDDAVMDDGPPARTAEGEATMVSVGAPSSTDLSVPSDLSAEFYLPFSEDGEGDPADAHDEAREQMSAAGVVGGTPAPASAVAPGAVAATGPSGTWEQLGDGQGLDQAFAVPAGAPETDGIPEDVALGQAHFSDHFDTSDFSGAHKSAARLNAALAEGGLSHGGANIGKELSDLTSGEIAAGIDSPNLEATAVVAERDRVSLPSGAARAVGAPEAIAFAEFSMAMPLQQAIKREPKRETFTPPNWRPIGDLDGPLKPGANLPSPPAYQMPPAPKKRRTALIVGGALVLSALAAAAVWFV